LGIVRIEGDGVVGLGVSYAARVEEFAEALGVASEGAVSLAGDAGLDSGKWNIEPDSDAGIVEAFAIAGPSEGTAT